MNKDIPIEVMTLLNYGVKPFVEQLNDNGKMWYDRIYDVGEEYQWSSEPDTPLYDLVPAKLDFWVEHDSHTLEDTLNAIGFGNHQTYMASYRGWIIPRLYIQWSKPGVTKVYELHSAPLDQQDIARIFHRMQLMQLCLPGYDPTAFGVLRSYGHDTDDVFRATCYEFEWDLETEHTSAPLKAFLAWHEGIADNIIFEATKSGFNLLTMEILRLTNSAPKEAVSMRL